MRKIGTGMQSIVARTALVLGIVATLCFTGAAWLIQKKAAEVIEKFGQEDIAAWPFWAAGEGYFARGRAYSAAGDRARAESDFKAALPLAGDPRVREKLLKTLRELTGEAK